MRRKVTVRIAGQPVTVVITNEPPPDIDPAEWAAGRARAWAALLALVDAAEAEAAAERAVRNAAEKAMRRRPRRPAGE
jgi:hypothetical protein